MPTYTYTCTTCSHTFDQVQAFHDDPLTNCPECQGALRKVYNSVGVVFKGSGFYRTDSRKSETTQTPSTTAPSTTAGSAGGSTPSTSTPPAPASS